MEKQISRSLTGVGQFDSSQSRWIALAHRTPSSHSSFVYGVKSTKIYCRPTCPARLARRANVVFYDTEDQARRDGFRPCKRCKPDDEGFVGAMEEVVTRVMALLRIKRDESMIKRGLKELAKEVGVTPSYLCRVFKKTMGVTVGAYMKEFEREISEHQTESTHRVDSRRSGVLESETELMGLPIIARSHSEPPHLLERGMAEITAGNAKEAHEFKFNLDEWFLTEDFLVDSGKGCIKC